MSDYRDKMVLTDGLGYDQQFLQLKKLPRLSKASIRRRLVESPFNNNGILDCKFERGENHETVC